MAACQRSTGCHPPAGRPMCPRGVGSAREASAGERRRFPTIEDVAHRAGRSRSGVSRVLNGGRNIRPAVRATVRAAIEELGYSANHAAQSLALGRSNTVAYLLSEGTAHLLEDPSYATFIRTFSQELRRRGRHRLVAVAADEDEEALFATSLSTGCVGGILLHHPAASARRFAQLARSPQAVVVLGQPLGFENQLTWVAGDDERVPSTSSVSPSTSAAPNRHRDRPLRDRRRRRAPGRIPPCARRRVRRETRRRGRLDKPERRARHRATAAAHPGLQGLFVASDRMATGAMRPVAASPMTWPSLASTTLPPRP